MPDHPASLIAFQRRCADDDACAAHIAKMRWPDGFRCPACGHAAAWTLRHKARTRQCTRCARQTSVTAGTLLHGSKLPLTAGAQGGVGSTRRGQAQGGVYHPILDEKGLLLLCWQSTRRGQVLNVEFTQCAKTSDTQHSRP